MGKNPHFWLSFAQTYGNDYTEAKNKGANDAVAALGATASSLLNASVEIGIDGASGFQGLPEKITKGDRSAALEWFLSGLEEGNEEVVQKFIDNSVSKVLYDGSTELLNPKEAIKDYAVGTLVGWGLGGSQIGAKKAVDTINRADQEHKDIKLREKEQEVIDTTYDDTSVKQERYGNKLTQNKNTAEKREGYNNYIDPDRFIEGLWDDEKNKLRVKN